MRLVLPRLYVILDAALLKTPAQECAQKLLHAGVRLIQYRDKSASTRELLQKSSALSAELRAAHAQFFVNDRADVAYLSGADGVHVGQDDLGVEEARSLMGAGKFVGVSTHNLEQFRRAAESSADYIAVGPIFPTNSKQNPDPVVGLDLLRQVRPLTRKPIVAIGGINLERAAEVIAAGADTISVMSDIVSAADPAARARQFLDLLDHAKPGAAA